MTRRISAREARAKFSELLETVHYTNEPVVVERKGEPFAVVISPEQFRTMQKEIERAWRSVEAVQQANAHEDPDEVLRDVTEVVEEVRQERYERSRKPAKGSRRY